MFEMFWSAFLIVFIVIFSPILGIDKNITASLSLGLLDFSISLNYTENYMQIIKKKNRSERLKHAAECLVCSRTFRSYC